MSDVKYYPIDEKSARIAHEMNSMRPFAKGRATAEYQADVDHAAALAAKRKSFVDPMYHDKIDGLLDTYARKLADNMNMGFDIDARMPSILIAGGGNFQARKKEKQNAARDRNMREYNEIKGLLHKIESTGTGGISSDDPNALDKLKLKLASLENQQEHMKATNKRERGQYKAWELSNNNANIRRIRERIVELERRAENPLQGWKFDGGEVVANADDNRLQILFEGKPDEALRRELKHRGFRWAPSVGAWQRQLTNNAIYAAREVLTASGNEG